MAISISALTPAVLCACTGTGILLLLFSFPILLRAWVRIQVRPRIFTTVQATPERETALVLGAALWPDGSPTPVLYDRVATAVDLLNSNRVKILFMSGDGRSNSYNEPDAMRNLAVELGAPGEVIRVDYAGLRTYDSLFRAQKIYDLERITIVTQRFHMDRALYLAAALGLDALGVAADRRRYRFLALQRSRVREVIATVKAWIDIQFLHRRNWQ